MERWLQRRLTRIEAKINLGLRALAWLLLFVVGFCVYLLSKEQGWDYAGAYGVTAGWLAFGLVEWEAKKFEKWFPHDED